MSQLVAVRESTQRSGERTQPVADPRTPGFHLFVESLASGVSTVADLPVLEVPAGVSYLAPAREPLALVTRKPRTPAFVFEPLRAGDQEGGRARLLLLTPAGLRARLNGSAVPRLALLKVADQLQLDARAVLHVTEYRRAGAVSVTPELVGNPCGVCRLPLTAETTVVVCTCGLPLHLEGPPKPAGERLECALLGCSCGAEVRLESGHVWEPEL